MPLASHGASIGNLSVKTIAMKLALAATVSTLLASNSTVAQVVLPPAAKAAQVQIVAGPSLEIAHYDAVIISWTTNNPGGNDDHYGVVNYGTCRNSLSRTASSPIRLNRAHPEAVFRVNVTGLQAGTTYYYTVTSMESDGKSDGVTSSVSQFTTAAPGENPGLPSAGSSGQKPRAPTIPGVAAATC
jgi:hypothetical protein